MVVVGGLSVGCGLVGGGGLSVGGGGASGTKNCLISLGFASTCGVGCCWTGFLNVIFGYFEVGFVLIFSLDHFFIPVPVH